MLLTDSDVRRINNIVRPVAQEVLLTNIKGKTLGEAGKKLNNYAHAILVSQYKTKGLR